MSRNVFTPFLSTLLVAALAALSAPAAEYWWTGGANDGLWSSADNWALDAEGTTPADAAPSRSERATCHFDVPAGGLVVTQDVTTGIVASNIVVTTSATDPVEMTIVSLSQGCEFEFSPGGRITVGAGATLVLNTDMGASGTNQELSKYGEGTLAFDLKFRIPLLNRPLIVYAGRVVVLPTSKNTRHIVKLAGADPANPPVYENQLDGGLYESLIAAGAGNIQLDGKTMKVGDNVTANSAKITTAYTIPDVLDSGTLSFANEHSYMLATNQPSYNIELDRADVTYAPETVMGMQFEDSYNPQKDFVGLGSRLVSIGEPEVVNDAERGNVLSLDGSSGFKGPDANNGLTEFNPMNGFTLAMWLKPDSDCGNNARVFFFGNGTGHASTIALRLEGGNKIRYTHYQGYVDYSISNLRGNWHHVALTYNGNRSYSFYLDGAPVALTWSAAMTQNLNMINKNFFIGHVSADTWWQNGTDPYKGLLDDVFLSNRELSQSEISAMYSNGLGAYSENLTFQSVSAKSTGALMIPASASVKTLSGTALGGGIDMTKAGTTLTVGTGAGETTTEFQGTVAGTDSTLVKAGANYTLVLEGAVKGVTNVVVSEGSLALYRPVSVDRKGLVCRYSFDDPSNFGRDDGPAGFDLSPGDVGTPTAIAGVENGAIHFPDVAGGYAYLQPGSAVRPSNFPSGNDSFTVSVWIRPTAATCTDGAVVCCWGGVASGTATGKLMLIRFNSANNKLMFVSSGENYNLNVEGLPNLSDGQWHHIVATYDGTSCVKKLYCDGVLKGQKTITGGLNITTDFGLELGHTTSSSSNSGKRYRGGMDEFMVFDRAWSAEEVLAEYSNLPVPAPTAHWTFDGDDPLTDTTGNYPLEAFRANDAQPNVTFESGDYICGKAARFTSTSGCLRRETFPEGVIPSGNTEFTLVVRYRPDTTQISANISRIVGWGTTGTGEMFALGTDKSDMGSVRAMLTDNNGAIASGMDRTAIGSDHTRWYTAALAYDKTKLRIYVDGALALTQTAKVDYNLVGGRLCIGSSFTGTRDFYGLVDDIQIFDKVLTAGQIRQVAEQLEASKGKAATSTATPLGVLADQPDVVIDNGATLLVASNENIGGLSGAGTVALASFGRLNVSGVGDFSGTVTGDGLVGIADGATLEFGDGSSPLLAIDRPLALGANVTINTTATQGRLLLAEAESFIDTDNLATWTATVGNRTYKVAVSQDGTELYLSIQNGTVLILL